MPANFKGKSCSSSKLGATQPGPLHLRIVELKHIGHRRLQIVLIFPKAVPKGYRISRYDVEYTAYDIVSPKTIQAVFVPQNARFCSTIAQAWQLQNIGPKGEGYDEAELLK